MRSMSRISCTSSQKDSTWNENSRYLLTLIGTGRVLLPLGAAQAVVQKYQLLCRLVVCVIYYPKCNILLNYVVKISYFIDYSLSFLLFCEINIIYDLSA